MLVDELVPEDEVNEVDSIRLFASLEETLEAVKLVTPGEMPLVRLLLAIRSLPARLAGKQGLPSDKTRTLYEQMLAATDLSRRCWLG